MTPIDTKIAPYIATGRRVHLAGIGAVAVLAGLQDNGLSAAHPVAAVEHGQGAPDHHRGVRLGGHEDVGGHGGGGGLAVGAGDADGVLNAMDALKGLPLFTFGCRQGADCQAQNLTAAEGREGRYSAPGIRSARSWEEIPTVFFSRAA